MDSTTIVDDYYRRCYSRIHGTGTLGLANRYMHRALESRRNGSCFATTIELGAGTNQHYQFVRHARTRYVATDIRDPGLAFFPSSWRHGIDSETAFLQADALRLPFPTGFADRVLAMCLIMHLADPMAAVAEWQRVCSPHGVVDFLVPCDPGVLTRLFRLAVSEPAARRNGVTSGEYRLVNAIEHVNPFGRILQLTKASITPGRALRVRYYPFGFASWNLNAFAVFSIEPLANR